MPDPTYKTFLSPGSCQLEITDLVAAANDDTGIDLYGVAWEIEQVLIAGEGFAASPTDVWVNERGILNVGQSLFDKINRTALDNTNIPGQCTVVVKATSLVDSSKVARLKVLVGYPSEGGGGGGGGFDDIGGLVCVLAQQSAPVVGAGSEASAVAHYVFVGDFEHGDQIDLAFNKGDFSSSTTIDYVASGLQIRSLEGAYAELETNPPKFYDVVITDWEFASVEEIEVEYTAIQPIPNGDYSLVFTVPELAAGHDLLFTATNAN